MTENTQIKIFEEKKVRTLWDKEKEEWYFSVVDVVAVLTDSDRPRKYWNDLKKKLQQEGSELSEKIGQLKMPAAYRRKLKQRLKAESNETVTNCHGLKTQEMELD